MAEEFEVDDDLHPIDKCEQVPCPFCDLRPSLPPGLQPEAAQSGGPAVTTDTVRRLRFRRVNRLFASMFGYFWLPCPLCGQMFGGHEWRSQNTIPTGEPGRGTGVCPAHDIRYCAFHEFEHDFDGVTNGWMCGDIGPLASGDTRGSDA